ncbi:hypothetical protein BT69DRAFT_256779 [Atractiella rhizophila]|nr:hypothetical protein BT69DRAFT_256779 [Atractiella rhizophila]
MMPKRSRESSTPTPRSSRKVKTKADSSQEGEGETQNSGSTWWSAKCILEERKGQYKIAWEGINPDTRQPWAPTWEPKSNASKSLVETWRRKLAGESEISVDAFVPSRRIRR